MFVGRSRVAYVVGHLVKVIKVRSKKKKKKKQCVYAAADKFVANQFSKPAEAI